MRVLSHAAIDHGVDIFIGHGPHRLRGIEIYKGKPIFYRLGNFFFQLNLEEPIVADMWERFKTDPAATTDAEFGERRRHRMFKEDEYYQSVIAVSQFAKGHVSEIRLYPVYLVRTAILIAESRTLPAPKWRELFWNVYNASHKFMAQPWRLRANRHYPCVTEQLISRHEQSNC